ncbi:hypothetical protein ACFX4I_12435 [Peribacillus sp. YIM B13472]|uniref:hypothetical protein n=1 Tax=Peribacillus sp. YIM B13472 TaxID=3366297 RepID=UPI00366DBF0C
MNINSTIQKPLDMEIINTGKHLIKGIAWTGKGVITKLEISIDDGYTQGKADIYLVRILVMDGLVGHLNGLY